MQNYPVLLYLLCKYQSIRLRNNSALITPPFRYIPSQNKTTISYLIVGDTTLFGLTVHRDFTPVSEYRRESIRFKIRTCDKFKQVFIVVDLSLQFRIGIPRGKI